MNNNDALLANGAENSTSESSHLSQDFLEAFPCVALVLRLRSREIVASNGKARKVGALPGTCCYSTWLQRQEPCPWCRAPVMWATGTVQHSEFEARGACWDAHWIPVRDDLYLHFAFDVTERRRMEAALRDSELKSRTLLEGSPVCNKIIDLDSRLQYMSAAGVKDLKIADIKPFYGQIYPPEFYPESMRAPLVEHLERAKAGETCSLECPVHDTEGGEVWFHSTFVPARSEKGEVKYVLVASVNITERKQREERLKQLAAVEIRAEVERERAVELEGALSRLTAAHAELQSVNAQLVQTAKLAALGELVSGVTHELNNPLFLIHESASRLEEALSKNGTVVSEQVMDYVYNLQKNTARMRATIGSFLSFARPPEDKLQDCDINEVIRDAFLLLRQQLSLHSIAVGLDLSAELPVFQGSSNRLEQVFVNLIVNARDALKDSADRKITVTSSTTDDGIVVTFSDNGQGISSSLLSRIFEPFVTTKRAGRGTGLGLSICSQIIQEHDGEITAASELDRGATFRITLPVRSAASSQAGPLTIPAANENV